MSNVVVKMVYFFTQRLRQNQSCNFIGSAGVKIINDQTGTALLGLFS